MDPIKVGDKVRHIVSKESLGKVISVYVSAWTSKGYVKVDSGYQYYLEDVEVVRRPVSRLFKLYKFRVQELCR